jgi:predicted NAD/FAD-binding protein
VSRLNQNHASIKKVAVIGAGISGLGCAYSLQKNIGIHVTLFEGGQHIGGHSNTIDIAVDTKRGSIPCSVDTGFLVFNRKTYPRLTRLFEELKVPLALSEMSFSVSIDQSLEWSGDSLNTLFGQRLNLARPAFWRMIKDIIRFNQLATQLALQQQNSNHGGDPNKLQSIASFLDQHGFKRAFREWYFLPMIGAIWSCPTSQMLEFPIDTMIRFCHNHGLLQVQNRPQWLTVKGGSKQYVKRIVEAMHPKRFKLLREAVLKINVPRPIDADRRIELISAKGVHYFDEVVMACHSDQSLNLLHGIDEFDRSLLAAIPYQENKAILHHDASVLPKTRRCWAAWNYKTLGSQLNDHEVSVDYLINKLQPLPFNLDEHAIIVSLNPLVEPKPETIFSEISYAHPLFNDAAIKAQKNLPLIQGKSGIWYCGAWTGYGFHEDGLRSGELVAVDLIASIYSPLASPPFQSAN